MAAVGFCFWRGGGGRRAYLVYLILLSFLVPNPRDRKMTVTTDRLVRWLVGDVLERCLNVFTSTTDESHLKKKNLMNIALAKWTPLAGWMLGYCLIKLHVYLPQYFLDDL